MTRGSRTNLEEGLTTMILSRFYIVIGVIEQYREYRDIRSYFIVLLNFGEVSHLDLVGSLEVSMAFGAVEVVKPFVGAVS